MTRRVSRDAGIDPGRNSTIGEIAPPLIGIDIDLKFPALLSGDGIQRCDFAEWCGDVESAVDHERSNFELGRPPGFRVKLTRAVCPCWNEILDVIPIDL